MNQKPQASVSHWISDLKAGNDDAMGPLWNRYFEILSAFAKTKLHGARTTVVDCDDIAASALNALWIGVREGRFQKLDDRNDLWQLLVVIASRKVSNVHRKEKQRGEKGESALAQHTDALGLRELLQAGPSEQMTNQIPLSCEELLSQLDKKHREVALMRLAGHSNQEIADSRDCSVKTVERYMNMIRVVWAKCHTE